MARGIHRLAPKALSALPVGVHSDGGGLYVRVKGSGARSWLFIYQWQGKRKETGLGSLAAVGLADAREKARRARELVEDGIDPAAKALAEAGNEHTFGQAADDLVGALENGWKNPKHRQQWRNTLKTHCAAIWAKPVAAIDTDDVKGVLEPIWLKTPETATRLRGRIERVLDAAKVKGKRTGENPARWRGHLEIILPKRKKKALQRHHPALPYADVGPFVRSLKLRLSAAARALEFLIFTAARTSEVLGMKWREVDLDAALWTVPGARMKMGVEHRVPLSEPALVVLRSMAVFGTDPEDYVFPSRKPGTQLSNMSMEMLLRRMDCDDVTVHGFRSSFRDWAGEETDFPREIAEAALAHQVGNEVERAYRRGDALAKRRALMEEWAGYVLADRETA